MLTSDIIAAQHVNGERPFLCRIHRSSDRLPPDIQVSLQFVSGSNLQTPTLTLGFSNRYDNGTDDYDTSDKMRIPAYTDRILYEGEGVRRTFACLARVVSPG